MSAILEANGQRWQVTCYRDGNRRRRERVVFVHAPDVLTAELIARRVSGCRTVDAVPWDPRRDPACLGYVECPA